MAGCAEKSISMTARGLLLLCLAGSTPGCDVERSFIYFPDPIITATPQQVGLPFEDLFLSSEDGYLIHGWFISYPGAEVTLLWLHGNAGNLGHRVDQLQYLHRAARANILMIDYREYGRSKGKVSEEGTYLDAVAAYDSLVTRADRPAARIIAYGQSLGAAVAVELALRRSLDGLILEAPFTSMMAMRRVHYPWLPVGGRPAIRYDSLAKVGRLRAPLLILHGDRDEIVPYEQGRSLYEAAKVPKNFYTVLGAGHNDVYLKGGEEYYRAISNFIDGRTERGE